MALKQEFTKQVEGQIAVWQAQVKDYQEQLAKAGADARSNYEKAMANLRERTDEANKLLQQVREANETAWKDTQTASQRALAELQKGWADALGRFM